MASLEINIIDNAALVEQPDRRQEFWSLLQAYLPEAILVATNLGVFAPPTTWITSESAEGMAVVGVYKRYRVYPFGNPDLVSIILDHLASLPETDPSRLNDEIAIVAIEENLHIPDGFKQAMSPAKHGQTAEAVSAEYKRFILTSDGLLEPEVVLPIEAQINRLSSSAQLDEIEVLLTPPDGEDPSDYSQEVYFYRDRPENGLPYVGLYLNGRLVSIAGTHGMAPDLGIAVIGDAFTNPDFRGMGFASALTHYLVKSLIEEHGVQFVGTDIRNDKPAYRLLEKLGFKLHPDLIHLRQAERV